MGKLVLKSGHRVMCGDSTSIDAVDKLMDGNSVDLLFTDPRTTWRLMVAVASMM